MTGKDLFEAGVPHLVCITPPGGALSPNSALKPESMGKAPGRPNQAGQWAGYNWRAHFEPSLGEVRLWDSWGANIGVHAGYWPAFDLDIEDEFLAEQVGNLIGARLGQCLVRTSRPPRRLYAFRATEPGSIVKHKVVFWYEGREHAVELLGSGQQWVACGTHPSGRPYETFIRGDITLDVDTALDLLAEIVSLLEALGATITEQGRGGTDRQAVAQDSLQGDAAEVMDLVERTPNDVDTREEWIRYGAALKGALQHEPDLAYMLWSDWCSRWTGGANEQDAVDEAWGGLHPPFALGIDYLRAQAGVNTAQYEFAVLAPGPDPRGGEVQPPAVAGGHGGAEQHGGDDAGGDGEADDDAGHYAYSDQFLARDFAARFGEGIRHAAGAGWYTWDGKRWRPDEGDKLVSTRLHSFLWERAQQVFNDPRIGNTKRESLAGRVASGSVANTILNILSRSTGLAVDPDAFDSAPYLLNTPDGVVDLRNGDLLPHDKDLMCSRMTRVGPGGSDGAIRWLQFIREITLGDEDYAAYMQKVLGYCLTGHTNEHALFFGYGTGMNGKSVLLETVEHLMGDYAAVAPPETFTQSTSDRHPTEIAALHGARFVSTSESRGGRAWDEEKVKRLTGDGSITARRMRQDFFTFTPRFKLFVIANNQPSITNLDKAWRRRMHLMPFAFEPVVPDKSLKDRMLAEEAEDIMAWLVEGAVLWSLEGIDKPEAVRDATEEYFDAQNPLGRWLEEECIVEPHAFTTTADLYERYQAWVMENHEIDKHTSIMAFSLRLMAALKGDIQKGRDPTQSSRRKGFHGIRLRNDGRAT